jgi:arylamine N-acetyltransferase
MLSKTEAIEFLQNEWKIKDVEQQLQNDREKFLNKLIITAHERVPFHVFFAHMPQEWRITDFVDFDKWCMSGTGGHCGIINMFMWRLLTALGFNAYLCLTIVTKSTLLAPHLVVIVKDLVKTGDVHLVDCGLGQPSFRAISLNFNKESPVFRDSILEYKYIKEDGMILRMHGKGDFIEHHNPPKSHDYYQGKWRRYYVFCLERFPCKNVDDVHHYTDVRAFAAFFSPRAVRFPGGKAVMILNYMLRIEQEDGTLKETRLRSYEEILKAYEEYFPAISKDIIDQAYSMWQKIKSKL